MDIKYIRSEEAAKALIYYVTDYITKATLPTHVALAAIEYAIRRNSDKFSGVTSSDNTVSDVRRSLFTKTVMALMSRQELSHQQVMSYLIGGGNVYRSHTFTILKWGDFDRFVRWCKNECANSQLSSASEAAPVSRNGGINDKYNMPEENDDAYYITPPDEITPQVDTANKRVSVSDTFRDYTLKSTEPAFADKCLWEYAECTVKITDISECS